MPEFEKLETSRLFLVKITPAIIHDLFNTRSKEDIISFFGFDDSGYQHLHAMHINGMETNSLSLLFFILVDKQTGKAIGECGFHTWNRKHRRAEAFYLLRSDEYKQKRLMTEAFFKVLEFGFNEMGLHRVSALVAAENTPSVKLLTTYDFKKEGTMREDYVVNGKNENSECYSLLRWEWELNNK